MDWQPIETAPRDGTRILVRTNFGVAIASWSPEAEFGLHENDAPGWQVFACGDYWYSQALSPDEVTGWMGLPAT